jgi:hypothetical protein
MAPASERTPFGGRRGGAGAAPLVLVGLALVFACACGDPEERRVVPEAAPVANRTAADPSAGMTTELDGSAPAFGDAVLAELTGDEIAARAGFEKVLAAPDVPSALAARAALHLAQLESKAGRTGHARDLALRASTLAPNDPVIIEGGAQIRAREVAASNAGDIRGPRLGTPLTGVDPAVADAFAVAEKALERVHKLRPQPIIETLSTSIRAKEDATESAVAQYHAIAEHGGLAQVAGHYRAGSLYHDLALGLLFDLPPELDPNVAAGLRRTLRDRARVYLRRAAAEYKLALDVPNVADSEWRLAAETDLRAAQDVLGEAAERK